MPQLTTESTPRFHCFNRRIALVGATSAVGISAAAYVGTVSPMIVVGAAIGIVSIAVATLVLKKQQRQTLDLASREAMQLFTAALAAAQQENKASVLPEHDMRADNQADATENDRDVPKDTPKTYTVRITHPNASSMVH